MKKILFSILIFLSSSSFSDTAIFAGGCFWCLEKPFDEVKGVSSTVVGYTGGSKDNPTYEEVSAGNTGHKEVIEVTYDPKKVTFDELLDIFWKNVDPYDSKGQFCDKGEQYTSVIYYQNEQEKKSAESTKAKIKGQVVTEILPAKKFFTAEEYHQDYYKKNPIRYKFYRSNCGRDKRLEEIWGKK